jgi:thymidylate synthase ThyX
VTITAKIIADSISEHGIRLTTLQLRYQRFFHQEVMTHRAFSRNASSSRAIPVQRMIEDVMNDPAIPIHIGRNKPGMQAGEELAGETREFALKEWLKARDDAVWHAQNLVGAGVHKQVINRIIEPWQHINVVCSATDWDNFFALRIHPDAQPEIQALATAIYEAREASEPVRLKAGQWHLPYITEADREEAARRMDDFEDDALEDQLLRRISAARCARVSYNKHDGTSPSIEDDLALFERLAGGQPIHASPMEHQAMPDMMTNDGVMRRAVWAAPDLHGNFTGWCQFRRMIPGNTVTQFTRAP